MSLPVVGATSLAGAIGHWREGNLDLRSAALFGAFAMSGAFLGARLASRVSGILQLTMLGIVMICSAILMLRPPRLPSAAGVDGDAAHSPPKGRNWFLAALVGLGVGILTGIVGIGGGFLFVPALVLLGRLPMKTAIGTSLLVITLNTIAGSLGYRGQVSVPWGVVLAFTAFAIGGIVVGTRLTRRVSQRGLRRSFAYFLFVMAAFILYQNRAVLADPGGALRPTNAGGGRR